MTDTPAGPTGPTGLPPVGRCADVSDDAGVPLGGSASAWSACLMIEQDGAWGPKILTDTRLSASLREKLATLPVRVLLVRRHGRSTGREGVRVMASWSAPDGSWLEQTTVSSPEDLLDVDLSGLGRGERLGWQPVHDPVVLVCTHGRRDVCCAERGRPVAAALAQHEPDATWECSHVGGHRFAANVVVLPEGLAYGRVDPAEAPSLVRRWREGILEPDRMRGWVWQSPAAQAVEVVVRSRLDLTTVDAVRVGPAEVALATEQTQDATTDVTVDVVVSQGASAGRYVVGARPVPVVTADGTESRVLASCGDADSTPARRWEVDTLA